MRHRSDVRLRAAAALGAAWLLACSAAVRADDEVAQAGPGAERYEVTITPPRRPAGEPSPTPNAAGDASAAAAREAAAPAGPRYSLQVAAYRRRASAEALRDALAPKFPDVALQEVQSGGQPLYRVTVARLPRGSEFDGLAAALREAGYAAFPIPAAEP